MTRLNTFAQNAARLLDKYPMRTATSEAVRYVTNAAATMSSFEQKKSSDQDLDEAKKDKNKGSLNLQPRLQEQLQSQLDQRQKKHLEAVKNFNSALNESEKINYKYVLESPPTYKSEEALPSNQNTKPDSKQTSSQRVEELRRDRDSFFEVGGHLMTSLFADDDLSREFKNNYNAFTQEIIKEQSKAKSQEKSAGHFESMVAKTNDEDIGKKR